MAYLTNVDGNSRIRSSLSPTELVSLFKQKVDFAPQPRKPVGTMSIEPILEVWKVVGTINPSESELRIRYDSQLSYGVAILVVAIKKGRNGGSEIDLHFEQARFTKQDKIMLIGAAVLFWGMLLSMIGFVHEWVPASEVQKIWGCGLLVTVLCSCAEHLGTKFQFKTQQARVLNFVRGLVASAESDYRSAKRTPPVVQVEADEPPQMVPDLWGDLSQYSDSEPVKALKFSREQM
jgi:hypothetical protein